MASIICGWRESEHTDSIRKHLYSVLNRRGPFVADDWVEGDNCIVKLEQAKVLYVKPLYWMRLQPALTES
jgi:hypothetical protein